MDNETKPTHILVVHRSQKAALLFRAQDGILCCMQQNAVVVMGDAPKSKDSHTFIDWQAAQKWLREVYPAKDLKLQGRESDPVVIEERDGEAHGLYVPDDSLELPGFAGGAPRAFKN